MSSEKQKKRNEQIVKLIQRGKSPADVAARYDISRQAVYQILKREGHRLEKQWVKGK